MPRDGKNKTPSEKTAVLRVTNDLTEYILRKLCNEKLFPKRSRWLMSGKLADLVNDSQTCVSRANEIRVITPQERDERHFWQTMAIALSPRRSIPAETGQSEPWTNFIRRH